MKPLTPADWRLIYLAMNYAGANFDDMVDAYETTDHEGTLGTEERFLALSDRAEIEANEVRKLALAFFEMFPREAPPQFTDEMWVSIECTFGGWLERLREDPASALSKTKWEGKVTKAYFQMLGIPLPYTKQAMVNIIKEYLSQ